MSAADRIGRLEARVSAARRESLARGETFYPGPSRVHLAAFPPRERWDDWVELDSHAWPRCVERRSMLVPTTCFNCESACGLLAYVDRDTLQVRKFEGNPEHPSSRGRNCAKGPARINQVTDPDRILRPLRRAGARGEGRWERVSWDKALDEVAAAVAAGAVVLDLRGPRPFAREHLPGALTMQFNRADLADRAELVLPRDLPLVVHAEPEPIARAAVELLAGAGFRVAGRLDGGLAAWKAAGRPTAELPLLDVDDLHAQLDALDVLDVREPFEFRHGRIPGARLLPSGDAWTRLDIVPAGRPLAVVCGDQTRSAAVASMLQHAGRDVRLVMGGMVDWLERGYPVEREPARV